MFISKEVDSKVRFSVAKFVVSAEIPLALRVTLNQLTNVATITEGFVKKDLSREG